MYEAVLNWAVIFSVYYVEHVMNAPMFELYYYELVWKFSNDSVVFVNSASLGGKCAVVKYAGRLTIYKIMKLLRRELFMKMITLFVVAVHAFLCVKDLHTLQTYFHVSYCIQNRTAYF